MITAKEVKEITDINSKDPELQSIYILSYLEDEIKQCASMGCNYLIWKSDLPAYCCTMLNSLGYTIVQHAALRQYKISW